MSNPRLQPPRQGAPAKSEPLADVGALDLIELAGTVCTRYRLEFPDEELRYGRAGDAWCAHDIQHLLNWAVNAVIEDEDMTGDVGWLATVLESRGFPVERLARGLELAADVVSTEVPDPSGALLVAVLSDAATFVWSDFTSGQVDPVGPADRPGSGS